MANKIEAKIALNVTGDGKVKSSVSKVTDSVDKATGSVSRFTKRLSEINKAARLSSIVNSFKIIKGSMSVAANVLKGSTIGIFNFVDRYASTADRMSKFSRAVGMSTADLQKWQYAARRGGVENESFNQSLVKMNSAVAKASNGSREYLSLFNALGVRIRDNKGNLRDNSSILLDVAEAYSKIGNAQDKIAVNEKLFGKGGTGLINVLEGGRSGVSSLLKRREELGGLFSEEDSRNAEAFKDSLEDVKTLFGGILKSVSARLLPSMDKLFKGISSWWTSNGQKVLTNVGKFGEKASELVMKFVDHLPQILDGVTWLFDKFVGIVDKIGLGKTALLALAPILGGTLLTSARALMDCLGGSEGRLGSIGNLLKGMPAMIGLVAAGIEGWSIAFDSFRKNWDLWKNTSLKEVRDILADNIWESFAPESHKQFKDMGERIREVGNEWIRENGGYDLVMNDYNTKSGVFSPNFGSNPNLVPKVFKDYGSQESEKKSAANESKLVVEFKNAPAGTKVKSVGDFNVDFMMNTGFVWEGNQ